ncbi:dihydrodipicolinate synthase family protein [Devosia riboflavina]
MPSVDLKGIVAAAITPVTTDFSIDVQRLKAHVDRLLGNGCSFVSTLGTTGEGASFSTREKLKALGELKAAGANMGRQVPAVMTPTLDDAAEMLTGLGALGARAALILPPFYYNAPEEGVEDWFSALIARTESATRIDLLLYNIPQLSRVRFTASLIETLIDRHGSRIVGVKDSTGDLDNGLMLVKTFPQLAILTGDDRVLPTLVRNGGAGMIGGMPNIFARDLRALYDNPDNAGLLDKQTQRILAVDRHGSLVALKGGLAHYCGDEELARPLPPLKALDAEGCAALLTAFAQSGYTGHE